MKLEPMKPEEFRYAVAVKDADTLWLVLWIHRTQQRAVVVVRPIRERGRHTHTTYHADGMLHMKSYDRVSITPQQRRRLDASFRGTESLFAESGFVPRVVNAICEPADFTAVLKVPAGVLGRTEGSIAIDLVEPGQSPRPILGSDVVMRKEFQEVTPWLVVSILRNRP